MKNKLILIASLCLVSSVVKAQDSTTIYYNDEWKMVENKIEASFYRRQILSNGHIYVKDYFIKGSKLQMAGSFKISTDTVREGHFVYYFKNGSKSAEGNFINDKEEGIWKEWFENGKQDAVKNYNQGYLVGNYESWFDNGNKRSEEHYISDLSKIKSFEEKDSAGKTRTISGVPEGACKYYFENGVMSAKEIWRNNKVQEIQLWNENGVSQKPSKNADGNYITEVVPHFKGGRDELMRYLVNNIKYPENSRKRNEEGKPVIEFVVDNDGSITNATIYKKSGHSLLDEEALRVVKTMGSGLWVPGMQHGQAVKVRFLLPVTFRLTN